MNNKVNYTLIGAIVLFGLALMLGFTYWLLKPSDASETKKYLIHFNESILGLNIDAPVKYRGITVGKVTNMQINPKNTEQVEVLITILKTTPIRTTTRARLTAQGITGLSYINLSMGERDSGFLEAKEGEEYPIIQTEPSFFDNIERSLDNVSDQFSRTLRQTERLLSDKNQEDLSLLLQSTASLMQKIDRTLDEQTITNLQKTIQNLERASAKFDAMLPKVEAFVDKSSAWEDKISFSFDTIMQSYLGIRSSMDEIKRAVSSGEFNVKAISQEVIPTLNDTLSEMQKLMLNMDALMLQYQRSPSDVLYKSQEVQKGPGE
jgi:phospholipid/cholesterol/gamma-HCH transport system substrate-binding protein